MLNDYIEGNYVDKVSRLDQVMVPELFRTDEVHLLNQGYRLFMDQVFTGIVSAYLQPVMIAEKRK